MLYLVYFLAFNKFMLAILLSILSGILISTSYIPFPPWALFFCFTPLWYVWICQNLSGWKVFLYGWLTQFTVTLIGFHWISHTAIEFGNIPEGLGFFILIVFCITQNLYIPFAGLIWHFVRKKIAFSLINSLLFLAITTVFLERFFPKIFYWNLGYPLFWAKWPIYQWADTIGFEGLSTLVFLINVYILWIFLFIKNNASKKDHFNEPLTNLKTIFQYIVFFLKNQKKGILHIIIFIGVFVFLNVTGKFKGKAWISTDKTFSVGAVQANIGSIRDYPNRYIYQKYFSLTENLLSQISNLDLVVWPETAFPFELETEPGSEHLLKSFILKNQKPLLTGAFSGDGDGKYYNGIFFFDSNGELLGKHRKSILLSFGEDLPLENYLPFLRRWAVFSQVSDFSAGPGATVFKWDSKGIALGVQICYEGLYPHFSADLAKQNADIIVNITNDSWYRNTYVPIRKTYEFFTNNSYIFQNYQHLYMTLARAIEVRRPIVRVTNTGISAAILADGTILEQQSEPSQEWAEKFEISYAGQPSLTLFTRFGKYIPLLQIVLIILIMGSGFYQKKYRNI